MKERIIWAAICLALSVILGAQEIVKNPDKPANANAGRVLTLKEELRISDAGGGFYLQYPRIIKMAPSGSIFICDREELIQFDAQGRFQRNLYKKGQGPGELNYVSNIEPVGDLLLVHSNDPGKLVWFDSGGKAVEEISLATEGRLYFRFHSRGQSYLFKQGIPDSSGKPIPTDLPFSLWSISDDGSRRREVTTFLTKVIAIQGAFMWDELLTAIVNDRYLFVGYTNPYSIKVYDLREGRLLRNFSRPYKRVPRPKDTRASAIISRDGRRYEMPGSEYLEDVAAVFAVGDELWVQTSTKDPKKGILFDVYNVEGRYVDAFYLKTAGRVMAIESNAVFTLEKTPDETLEIAKYRIVR